MSQTTNGPTLNSPTHQLSIQRGMHVSVWRWDCFANSEIDFSFVPLALLGFIGLAGIAAWLGQVGSSINLSTCGVH